MTAHPKPRHDGWTPRVRAAFLEALATTGMVAPALKAVRRGHSAAYALRRRDPAFAAAWDKALADAVVPVETMLVERALTGERVRLVDDAGRTLAEQHRFDSRFALRLLTRLDRKAEGRSITPAPGRKDLETRHFPARSGQSGIKAEFHP